jgi:PAS domain S-box-containing protein
MGDLPSQPRLTEAWTHSAGAFRALIDELEEAIYVLNSEGRFVTINRAFRRWLGRPETEILGRTVFDLWPQPLAEKETAENQRVLEGERLEAEEERPRSGAAGPLPLVRILKVPVRDGEGVVRGVLCRFREVLRSAQVEPIADAVSPSRNREQPSILLADRDPSIIQLAQTILRRSGYLVLPAASGREVLDIYRRNPAIHDLVILDQHLTDLSGLETLNELLAMNADVRVLLVTAGDPPDPSWGARTPGWGLLSKPYTAEQLVQAVREVLSSGERPA